MQKFTENILMWKQTKGSIFYMKQYMVLNT